MAEDTLLPKDRHSARSGEQRENQKHHQCALLACNSLGVGGPQSDHERSPECKATESTRHPSSGRDLCNSEGVARTSPHHDRVGCFHGLRRGELIGLRWEDVDFEVLVLHIRGSVVAMVQGLPKNGASQKDVPLDAQVAESLFTWRQRCTYTTLADWVFASPQMKGKQPYWPGTLWRYYGRPALKRAKVTKNVTYHTFRHTFGTLLNANGENAKVVQELLRHASLKVTTDVYMQAVSSQKREAQSKLVNMVMNAAVLAK